MKMDFDDTLLHYLLVFGGIVAASAAHRLADLFGWDTLKAIRNLWLGKERVYVFSAKTNGLRITVCSNSKSVPTVTDSFGTKFVRIR